MDEFWFNVETRQVEHGRQSPWEHLMGPYPTREAAEHALERAHERTEAWDEADEAWSDD
jgi:hypothetical protein